MSQALGQCVCGILAREAGFDLHMSNFSWRSSAWTWQRRIWLRLENSGQVFWEAELWCSAWAWGWSGDEGQPYCELGKLFWLVLNTWVKPRSADIPLPHLKFKRRCKESKPALPSRIIQSDGLGPPQRGKEQSLNFREEMEGAGAVEVISISSSSQRA